MGRFASTTSSGYMDAGFGTTPGAPNRYGRPRSADCGSTHPSTFFNLTNSNSIQHRMTQLGHASNRPNSILHGRIFTDRVPNAVLSIRDFFDVTQVIEKLLV